MRSLCSRAPREASDPKPPRLQPSGRRLVSRRAGHRRRETDPKFRKLAGCHPTRWSTPWPRSWAAKTGASSFTKGLRERGISVSVFADHGALGRGTRPVLQQKPDSPGRRKQNAPSVRTAPVKVSRFGRRAARTPSSLRQHTFNSLVPNSPALAPISANNETEQIGVDICLSSLKYRKGLCAHMRSWLITTFFYLLH